MGTTVGATIGDVVEGMLMLMLGVAIYYGWRLNGQIASIRSGREDLQKLIGDFSDATGRAEAALAELKSGMAETLMQSREATSKAMSLCDDLEFLIKRGEKVADTLEISIRAGAGGEAPTDYAVSVRGQGRDLTASPEDRPEVPIERKAPARKSAAKKARAKSKSDLLKALRDMR